MKLFHRGQLIKTHPRQPAGGRQHRPGGPARRAGRLRDAGPGPAQGHRRPARREHRHLRHRLLDDPLPWTRMRAVYRLLGLVRRYGPGPVDTACGTALELDVVSRPKIAAMLAKALENTAPGAAGRRRSPRRPVRPRPGRVPQPHHHSHARAQPTPGEHHPMTSTRTPPPAPPARPAGPSDPLGADLIGLLRTLKRLITIEGVVGV